MPNITFPDGKTYSFSTNDLNISLISNRDMHGNSNIFSSINEFSLFQILHTINPNLLATALAATIDCVPHSLSTIVTKDCSIGIIHNTDSSGSTIYYRSLALLFAEAVGNWQPALKLQDIQISQNACTLNFLIDGICSLSASPELDKQLAQFFSQNTKIITNDIWQKEMLLNLFSSLALPYNATLLSEYDDYDFVPVAIHNNFCLVNKDFDIYTLFPDTLQNFVYKFNKNKNFISLIVSRKP